MKHQAFAGRPVASLAARSLDLMAYLQSDATGCLNKSQMERWRGVRRDCNDHARLLRSEIVFASQEVNQNIGIKKESSMPAITKHETAPVCAVTHHDRAHVRLSSMRD